MPTQKITPEQIRAFKRRQPLAALTTYDYSMTRLLDDSGVPLLLVGDSLGMVALGYPDTTFVTMQEMEHHVRAAARAKPRALLAADLPYRSYRTAQEALQNARRLIEAGADAIKAEGGVSILPQIEALVQNGIPVLGHVGLLPQSIQEEGGYHIKGKTEAEQHDLLLDAQALERAGAFAIVLELVAPSLAARITQSIAIPTIGIGSGAECDGQILVTTDLFGTSAGYIPKHVRRERDYAAEMRETVRRWIDSLPGRQS